jgi:uncharacterized membrane protein YczE
MLIGLLFFAIGVVITIRANIGYAPWDVFHVGLTKMTGLSLGTISILVGFAVLVIVSLFREKLGLGTVCNMVLIGLFIDLIIDIIPTAENHITGTIMLLLGLFTVAIGTYFYIKSGFGVGPRDNLMVVLTRITKLPTGLCRGIVELIVTIGGWLLGGMVGYGTVISVVAIGFFIQIVFKIFRFDVTAVKHETLRETYLALRRIKTGSE